MMMRRITIEKLFGKYSCKLDLSSRCLVLIGENGVGKSTIINMLNYFTHKDFIGLLQCYFESITLEVDTGFIEDNEGITLESMSVTVKYEDFFPTKDDLLATIREYFSANSVNHYIETDIEYNSIFSALEWLISLGYETYYKYLSSCIFDRTISFRVSEEIRCYTEPFISNPDKLIKTALLIPDNEVDLLDSFRFLRNAILSSHEKFKEIINRLAMVSCYSIDMVQNYTIDTELQSRSVIESSELTALVEFNRAFEDLGVMDTNNPNPFNLNIKSWGNEDIINSMKTMSKIMLNAANKRAKYTKESQHVIGEFASKLKTGAVEINNLLSRFYYDEEFIKNFNKRAINIYQKLIDAQDSYTKLPDDTIKTLEAFFSDEEINRRIRLFFNPVLIKDSPFTQAGRIDDEIRGFYQYSKLHLAFHDFYYQEIEGLFKTKSKKTETFSRLVTKYIRNKGIIITPSGLLVSSDHPSFDGSKDYSFTRAVDTSIPLNQLSSGEKKILLLFALSVFFDQSTLIIDEPELSLSIVWQETLLRDILDNTNVKSLIVATHSPFIVKDESLLDYLVPLPYEGQ